VSELLAIFSPNRLLSLTFISVQQNYDRTLRKCQSLSDLRLILVVKTYNRIRSEKNMRRSIAGYDPDQVGQILSRVP
jgi:hypothetical protein